MRGDRILVSTLLDFRLNYDEEGHLSLDVGDDATRQSLVLVTATELSEQQEDECY